VKHRQQPAAERAAFLVLFDIKESFSNSSQKPLGDVFGVERTSSTIDELNRELWSWYTRLQNYSLLLLPKCLDRFSDALEDYLTGVSTIVRPPSVFRIDITGSWWWTKMCMWVVCCRYRRVLSSLGEEYSKYQDWTCKFTPCFII